MSPYRKICPDFTSWAQPAHQTLLWMMSPTLSRYSYNYEHSNKSRKKKKKLSPWGTACRVICLTSKTKKNTLKKKKQKPKTNGQTGRPVRLVAPDEMWCLLRWIPRVLFAELIYNSSWYPPLLPFVLMWQIATEGQQKQKTKKNAQALRLNVGEKIWKTNIFSPFKRVFCLVILSVERFLFCFFYSVLVRYSKWLCETYRKFIRREFRLRSQGESQRENRDITQGQRPHRQTLVKKIIRKKEKSSGINSVTFFQSKTCFIYVHIYTVQAKKFGHNFLYNMFYLVLLLSTF